MVMELSTYLRRTPGEGLGQGVECGQGDEWAMLQGFQATNQAWPPPHPVSGSVLYISLHRYDHGTFFPMGDEGTSNQVGRSAGTGFTVNVAWNGPRVGDSEYLAAWHRLVLPIAYEVHFRMYATQLCG